jgi:hypothetical protein
LQNVFSDRIAIYGIDELSSGGFNFVMHNPLIWIAIVLTAGLYVFCRFQDSKEKLEIVKFTIIRNIYFIALIVGIVAVVIYIILNTNGMLPEAISSKHNYLYFDNNWGSLRGATWIGCGKCIALTLVQDIRTFLFGSGPDGLFTTIYTYFPDFEVPSWGQTTIACAHNEWLNMFITVGVLGGIAYLGIFISSIVKFAKESLKHPEGIACVTAMVAYMASNTFCYQTVCCTPVIFSIIGIGAYYCRCKNDNKTK